MFLFDKGTFLSYEDLLNNIAKATSYFPVKRFESLNDYFSNLLTAIISNNRIVLLDSNLQDSELQNLEVIKDLDVEKNVDVGGICFESYNDFLNQILESQSKIILFTSGTTGQPKRIEHNIQSLTRAVKQSEKLKNVVWGYAYSPTHMAGLQVFFQALFNHNLMVNVFAKQRTKVFELIEENKISYISATPTFYRLLLPFEKKYDSVLNLTFGGEKSSNKLYEQMQQIFPKAKINNIYASTEAGSLFYAKGEVFSVPDKIKDKIKIVNNELYVHKTLIGKSDVLKIEGDYYNSGDLVEVIEKNPLQFKFISRKNEMINVGGFKVNPNEVEDVISTLDEVIQVKVYSKPNSVLGNIVCANIVLKEGFVLSKKDLLDKLKLLLQDYKIPRIIKFVDGIELTRTGKMKR